MLCAPESIAAQFLTFVTHEEQSLLDRSLSRRKIFLPRGQRKVRFSVGWPTLARFSLSGRRHIFRAYPSTHKVAELCLKTVYNLCKALGYISLLPLRKAGKGFAGVLPLPLIFDPPLYILNFTEKQR